MLVQALKAKLPLIGVHTKDTVNFVDVLKHLVGGPVFVLDTSSLKLTAGNVYYLIIPHGSSTKIDCKPLYEKFLQAECTLVILNETKPDPLIFQAGEVPTPKVMLSELLTTVTDDVEASQTMLQGLGGLTIKEVSEFARLTMSRDSSLTAKGLMQSRKDYFQQQPGLTLVDREQTMYLPHIKLAQWAKKEMLFFLHEQDNRLIPRGLLADGAPGTGKTAGAKYLANMWGVPLYKFDISGTKNKYVGESERMMMANLERLDHEEPAVVLFDEIEKVFSVSSSSSDSGVTSGMLSQLLWWLAERKSRVFAYMTTNAAKKLPPEIYREGRVDEVLVFEGLDFSHANDFVRLVLETFKIRAKDPDIKAIVAGVFGSSKSTMLVTQAALTQASYAFVKKVRPPNSGKKQ